jgi:hypothetical protein
MTLWHAVVLVSASYLHIGLRAMQQLNVQHNRYAWVPVVSSALALCEVYVIATLAKQGVGWAVPCVAVGATFGTWTAMYIHKRLR